MLCTFNVSCEKSILVSVLLPSFHFSICSGNRTLFPWTLHSILISLYTPLFSPSSCCSCVCKHDFVAFIPSSKHFHFTEFLFKPKLLQFFQNQPHRAHSLPKFSVGEITFTICLSLSFSSLFLCVLYAASSAS